MYTADDNYHQCLASQSTISKQSNARSCECLLECASSIICHPDSHAIFLGKSAAFPDDRRREPRTQSPADVLGMAANGQEQLSLQALESLEGRLKQVEFYITGGEDYEEERFTDAPETASARAPEERLRGIEERLAGLTTKNKVAADILNLRELFEFA